MSGQQLMLQRVAVEIAVQPPKDPTDAANCLIRPADSFRLAPELGSEFIAGVQIECWRGQASVCQKARTITISVALEVEA